MIKRRKTRTVTVGNVKIGSGHPVSIQSMTKTHTRLVAQTVKEIHLLEKAGCELVRVAVKDSRDAEAIHRIKEKIHIPLIADIHFDHRLALEAIASGADKIRINPGNISKKEDIDKVVGAAGEKNIPIRIGVNSGSIPSDRMVKALDGYLKHFEKRAFRNIVISLKSSSPRGMVESYRKMASRCDYPFHLGVTAAGSSEMGIVRSSMGIGALLMDGIGDTIRVSLTGPSVPEIGAAKRILVSAGVRNFGPEIIACPTCGRCEVDLVSVVRELEQKLKPFTIHHPLSTKRALTVAVMGCEVNGPGEAKAADMGVAFGKGKGAIFCRGKIIKTVKGSEAVRELVKLVNGG